MDVPAGCMIAGVTQTGDVAESRLSDWIALGVLAFWVAESGVLYRKH